SHPAHDAPADARTTDSPTVSNSAHAKDAAANTPDNPHVEDSTAPFPLEHEDGTVDLIATHHVYFGNRQIDLDAATEIPLVTGDAAEAVGEYARLGLDEQGIYIVESTVSPFQQGTYINGKQLNPGEKAYLHATDGVMLGRSPGQTLEGEPLFVLPNDVAKAPVESVARESVQAAKALKQSNDYATNHEISERLEDGWHTGARSRTSSSDGNLDHLVRNATIVDRQNDPVLRAVIEEARKRFGDLPPSEMAEALNQYVHSLLKPNGMSEKALDQWYAVFRAEHAGERVYLGEHIRQGKGVCNQQAVLLKVLGDELGLKVTLVQVAADPNFPDVINHALTEITVPGEPEPLVYDPRAQVSGKQYSELPHIVRGSDIQTARIAPELSQAQQVAHLPSEISVRGKVLEVRDASEGGTLIGRGHKGTVEPRHPKANHVSQNHAVLSRTPDGRLFIKDISANGTWINGNRIPSETTHVLGPKDVVHLGATDGPELRLFAANGKEEEILGHANLGTVRELPPTEVPSARVEGRDVDGRPVDAGFRPRIRTEFAELTPDEKLFARQHTIADLQSVRASGNRAGADGSPESVYDRFLTETALTDTQKEHVLDMLSEVREHYASLRTIEDEILPDQAVNWIHTQGEFGRVLEAGKANGLSGQEIETALIASMFSDSAKYTETAITRANFTTHHLDGALAAHEVMTRAGFPPQQIVDVVATILEHQIAPPEFMGMIYRGTIAGALERLKAQGALTPEKYAQMKFVLDSMVANGPDNIPRIAKIAKVNQAPLVKGADGQWEVAFTAEEKELLALAGIEHWYVPADPSADPDFAILTPAEQARAIARNKIARSLIDGDAINNYADDPSKIVAIRGPKTIFRDATVWESIKSVDTSFKDAYEALSDEGRQLATRALADRNAIVNDSTTGIRAQMDSWLAAQGDRVPRISDGPDQGKIAFYDAPLKYPKPLTAEEAARLKSLQDSLQDFTGTEAARQSIASEISDLTNPYRGLNEAEIAQFMFAQEIRQHMVNQLRIAQRTDGQIPGSFPQVRGTIPPQ
ncbi:MAG: FHA domain-containing protein, partial [Candidatus Melainabacteria bacterium]|nr:FHA domain-containing protein [Candidatus Melainabacteria bacterium]